jgi:hypothetical protein
MRRITRRYFLGSLPLLAITWNQRSEAAPAFSFKKESIGGIKMWMPISQVQRILGSPSQRSAYLDNVCGGGVAQVWQYPGLEIYISADNH